MLLRDLTKVYISEYEEIEDHGETEKKWKYKGQAWLNMQNDVIIVHIKVVRLGIMIYKKAMEYRLKISQN